MLAHHYSSAISDYITICWWFLYFWSFFYGCYNCYNFPKPWRFPFLFSIFPYCVTVGGTFTFAFRRQHLPNECEWKLSISNYYTYLIAFSLWKKNFFSAVTFWFDSMFPIFIFAVSSILHLHSLFSSCVHDKECGEKKNSRFCANDERLEHLRYTLLKISNNDYCTLAAKKKHLALISTSFRIFFYFLFFFLNFFRRFSYSCNTTYFVCFRLTTTKGENGNYIKLLHLNHLFFAHRQVNLAMNLYLLYCGI